RVNYSYIQPHSRTELQMANSFTSMFLLSLLFTSVLTSNVTRTRVSRDVRTVCTPDQVNDLLSCYARFLALYNLVIEQVGARSVLPRFSRLYYEINRQSLSTMCLNWNVLTQCAAPINLQCINKQVFNTITYDAHESTQWMQNHAFFEYACGAGNNLFMANEGCLTGALAVSSFSKRLLDCGGDSHIEDPGMLCVAAQNTNRCITDSFRRECGESAAIGACHASTNIARRAEEVEPMCLIDMDLTCSSANYSIIFLLISTIMMSLSR
ncbi:hypothetical protein PFISCL1PPCAC_1095, partial [Pristionchus fissidentatus]